jgi:hypothetical protein
MGAAWGMGPGANLAQGLRIAWLGPYYGPYPAFGRIWARMMDDGDGGGDGPNYRTPALRTTHRKRVGAVFLGVVACLLFRGTASL